MPTPHHAEVARSALASLPPAARAFLEALHAGHFPAPPGGPAYGLEDLLCLLAVGDRPGFGDERLALALAVPVAYLRAVGGGGDGGTTGQGNVTGERRLDAGLLAAEACGGALPPGVDSSARRRLWAAVHWTPSPIGRGSAGVVWLTRGDLRSPVPKCKTIRSYRKARNPAGTCVAWGGPSLYSAIRNAPPLFAHEIWQPARWSSYPLPGIATIAARQVPWHGRWAH
jgi:hypothetical protein